MIGFLRSWCEGITISIFVTIIIEMLVPTGNIKKYVRVIIGIYIVFVILNPIVSNIKNIDIDEFLSATNIEKEEVFSNNRRNIRNIY
ncbi:MAG: stage III sporulation protein AF [Clostridia bacterium]|nr:stage III sporulation protein AF [Clostridia bacterium]